MGVELGWSGQVVSISSLHFKEISLPVRKEGRGHAMLAATCSTGQSPAAVEKRDGNMDICVYLVELVCVAEMCLLEIGTMSLTVRSVPCICVSVCMYMCCSALVRVHRYQLSARCVCVSTDMFLCVRASRVSPIDPPMAVCIISRERIYNLRWGSGMVGGLQRTGSGGVWPSLGKWRELSHRARIDL